MAQILQMNRDAGADGRNGRKLLDGLISQATELIHQELAGEHAAEPIKDLNDIIRVSQFLIRSGRYRDNMLFITGINFGLRISDLLSLRFCNLIKEDGTFRDRFPILEQKTKDTRKTKKNRYITINTAVMDAVTLYLAHTPGVSLSDYMFRSESNHGKNCNSPLHRSNANRILKGIAEDLGLGNRMSSHSLRKTFGYHQMLMSRNDPRKLLLLQKMFGHSDPTMTLEYIGITGEEIDDAYRSLNLGSVSSHYLSATDIIENDAVTA